jgi:uncharacterized membrane protein YiaA
MMTKERMTLILKCAALFNMSGGGLLVLLPDWSFQVLYGKTAVSADDLLRTYHLLLFGFVVMIGIGVWNSASEPAKNRGILIASILGKTFAALVWLRMFVMHQGTVMLAIAAVADLAWAIVFALILRRQTES